MYLIMHGDLKGFNDQELLIMANIARYHRKAKPKLSHSQFAELPSRARRVVAVGASLLRLADGLDRSHCSVVSSLACTVRRRKIDVRIRARGDAELEIWGAQRKMELFAETFGRTVSFRESQR
jgi:exopolyphosphatase/guanosine-5'-triphosphate,3'-diphosphate pyrophosphatase